MRRRTDKYQTMYLNVQLAQDVMYIERVSPDAGVDLAVLLHIYARRTYRGKFVNWTDCPVSWLAPTYRVGHTRVRDSLDRLQNWGIISGMKANEQAQSRRQVLRYRYDLRPEGVDPVYPEKIVGRDPQREEELEAVRVVPELSKESPVVQTRPAQPKVSDARPKPVVEKTPVAQPSRPASKVEVKVEATVQPKAEEPYSIAPPEYRADPQKKVHYERVYEFLAPPEKGFRLLTPLLSKHWPETKAEYKPVVKPNEDKPILQVWDRVEDPYPHLEPMWLEMASADRLPMCPLCGRKCAPKAITIFNGICWDCYALAAMEDERGDLCVEFMDGGARSFTYTPEQQQELVVRLEPFYKRT